MNGNNPTEAVKTEKEWLMEKASMRDFSSRQSYEKARIKYQEWEKAEKISKWLDGIIYGYILGVFVYILIYLIWNKGVIPVESWNVWIAAGAGAASGIIFALIWGIKKKNKRIMMITEGQLVKSEQYPNGNWYMWFQLAGIMLPVKVNKGKIKGYMQGERVFLFCHSEDDRIHLMRMLSKKERKKLG